MHSVSSFISTADRALHMVVPHWNLETDKETRGGDWRRKAAGQS